MLYTLDKKTIRSEIMNFDFEEFCKINNISIIYSNDLASSTRGFCYYDGYEYNIVINAKLGTFQNKKTTLHELIHIFENHFLCANGYEKCCEKEVDNIIQNIKNTYNLTV